MDIILLSDDKLKVKLSPEDMKRLSISCDSMDYDNTGTRRAFWDILDKAKEKTGFDAAKERVFVQVYPSRDGGCDMYVTKASSLQEGTIGDKQTAVTVLPQKSKKWLTYSFDNADDMICVCYKLKNMGYSGDSRAFCEERADARVIYYLVLWNFAVPSSGDLGCFDFICDYGRRHKNFASISYIGEHCECIAKNGAVRILSDLH